MADKVVKSYDGDSYGGDEAYLAGFLFKQICLFLWKKGKIGPASFVLRFFTFCRPFCNFFCIKYHGRFSREVMWSLGGRAGWLLFMKICLIC